MMAAVALVACVMPDARDWSAAGTMSATTVNRAGVKNRLATVLSTTTA